MVREAGDDITTRSRRERRAERTRPHSKHAHIRAPPRFPSAACAVRVEEGAREEGRGKRRGGGTPSASGRTGRDVNKQNMGARLRGRGAKRRSQGQENKSEERGVGGGGG